MLKLCSTYLIVKDLERSVHFYASLLEREPEGRVPRRWVEFHGPGYCLALFDPSYDRELLRSGRDLEGRYNEAYMRTIDRPAVYGNNVVLNFYAPDLAAERGRVEALRLGPVSEIQYINISAPYYCFTLGDPDGNLVEIAGALAKEEL